MTWDGVGRRVSKEVQNSADWNAAYHYDYDGHSVVEERNASNKTLKQAVWGTENRI